MPEFELSEGDPNFRQRSTDIFACLEGLATDHESFQRQTVAEREDVKRSWRTTEPAPEFLEKAGGSHTARQEDKKAPEFAVPRVPPRHCHSRRARRGGRGACRGRRGPPDHVRHPERWTSYSLEDVEEVTDAQNATAAFDFLAELRKRREVAEKEDEEEDGRILFRPKHARKEKERGVEERTAKRSWRQHCRSSAPEEVEEEEEEEEILFRPKRADLKEKVPERTSSQHDRFIMASGEGEEEEEEKRPSKTGTGAPIVFRKNGHGSRRRAIRARLSDDEDTG